MGAMHMRASLAAATVAVAVAGCNTPSGGQGPVGPILPTGGGGTTQVAQATGQVPQGYFRMQTQFLETQNRCLESNRVAPGATLGGATFMDTCQNVSGQVWRAIPQGNGYYRLTSQFLEAQNMCLEGSKPFAAGDFLNGAARMDPCGNFSGQLWRFIPQGNGYFQITNQFLEGENRCLESSSPTAVGDPLNGAARMDPCGNFSGQMWKLTPV